MSYITIDKNELTITVSETLSFERNVMPVYSALSFETFKAVESGIYSSLDAEDQLRQFTNYYPTDDDKLDILEYISREYQNRLSNLGDAEGLSLYDPEIIESAVSNWVRDKFDITWIPRSVNKEDL